MEQSKQDILRRLEKEILPLQGYKAAGNDHISIGCSAIESAFPLHRFPVGAVHEFVSSSIQNATVSAGFIAGTISALLKNGGAALWIGTSSMIFPAALSHFNINPSDFIFIDAKKEQHALWATEEALKCNGITAVISELKDLNFTNSRRFQLAVEQSRCTAFIIHHHKKQPVVNACVSRWRITPQPSARDEQLPGVLFPRWKVELLKVRNGHPGEWIIEWNNNRLVSVEEKIFTFSAEKRKVG